MKDWIKKLNDILIINEREILDYSGKVSKEDEQDYQLNRAIDLLRGVIMYGDRIQQAKR